jgi:hypothetical protein
MKRIALAVATLAFSFATLAVKAQAPETAFSFNDPSTNAASCGGGFTCSAGFSNGTQDVSVMFPVGGGAFTVRMWNPTNANAPQISLSGGDVTGTQTLTNPGKFPAIYHVVQTISNARQLVNGVAVGDTATATLEYDWQRTGHSGRGGGSSLTFSSGIKLAGSY